MTNAVVLGVDVVFSGRQRASMSASNADIHEFYKGQLNSANRPHGVGVQATPKEVYQGGFKDGLKHGLGRRVSRAGVVYEGNWKRGKRHGTGEHRTEASVYRGEWQHDVATGKGYYETSAYQYFGDFVNDYFHGRGEIVYEDGTRFEGEFCRGQLGKGQFTSKKLRKQAKKLNASEEPTGVGVSQLGIC